MIDFRLHKLKRLLFALIAGLIAWGCTQLQPDRQLTAIESIIEEHPDSAMNAIDGYVLDKTSNKADSALYYMLLTLARYKNYIDDTDDSLINFAVDYYDSTNDYRRLATSLYLKGLILQNTNQLGQAAMAFMRGRELAIQHGHHFEHGLCARGLTIISLKGYDGPHSEKFAREMYEAFKLTGYDVWKRHAFLDIAIALNNLEEYDRAILTADSLIDMIRAGSIATTGFDSVFTAEAYRVKAGALYATNHPTAAVESMVRAYRYDSTALTNDDKMILNHALTGCDTIKITASERDFAKEICKGAPQEVHLFIEYADKGDYKMAYELVNQYRLHQDSILSFLSFNDLAASLNNYQIQKATELKTRQKFINLLWLLGTVFLLMIITFGVILFRKKQAINSLTRESLLNNLHSLAAEVQRITADNIAKDQSIKKLFRERFHFIDDFCKVGYETYSDKIEQKRMLATIRDKFTEITNDDGFLKEVGTLFDTYHENLHSDFHRDFPTIKNIDEKLFVLTGCGFSSNSIAFLLDESLENIYRRRSRLKNKIAQSDSPRKEDYLNLLSKKN